jgi:hypothetical protein
MRMRIALTILVGAAVLAGCSGDDGDTTTTAGDGSAAPLTTLAGGEDGATGSTVAGGATTTTIDLGDPVIPEWEVVSQSDGDDGATLVVVLDPESYQSLTDIDLQNVVADVVETEEGDVAVVHLVDDAEVAEFVEEADPTRAQQRQLDIHYLARLEDGFRIVFLGPFSDTAPVVLGS